MESPVNGEGGSFVDAWWVESLAVCSRCSFDRKTVTTVLLFLSQPSLCAAGRPRSAGVACPRAPSQVAAISGAQTHAGVQECTGTNRQVRSLFTLLVDVDVLVAIIHLFTVFYVTNSILSDWVSFQRAHVHLHDWRQPALHPADHLPAHLGLHGADSGAAEASDRGRWGDPEPRDRGERGGRAGWEDASHQATQNR